MTRVPATAAAILLASAGPVVAQDAPNLEDLDDVFAGRPYSPYADRSFPANVYFGDTHVHTALSVDAAAAGARLRPRDAYRFARGEQVVSSTGQPVRLARPLDFSMITDHSDGLGAMADILAGAPNIMADRQGRRLHEALAEGGAAARAAAVEVNELLARGRLAERLGYGPDDPARERAWDEIVAAAEELYEPGVFTTFIAFEWTSSVGGDNLHRNVVFRDGAEKAGEVTPFTTAPPAGSPDPRDLWAWMADYEATTGGDVMAIPHGGNLSNGMMFALQDDFADGAPLDVEYAKERAAWERLYEITQYKGDSEAHPALSPEDELADFETWDFGNLDASTEKAPEMLPGEYVRSALSRGLELEAELGVNPFKFGVVGGTDAHTGLSTTDEDNFFGAFAAYEPRPERTEHVVRRFADGEDVAYRAWRYSAAGLTAVWAAENTREAIFDAMERRETYATTGPRMRVRFFGGWAFAEDDALERDVGLIGYAKGVPMGSDLPAPTEGARAPSFLVFASRDPLGANLDRIQIIKGWIDAEGEPRERAYDVAWSGDRQPDEEGDLPPVGSTVDLSIPGWTNAIGAADLGAVWTDPDFDPSLRAFYYARVIEIPTPRWTAYDRVAFGLHAPTDIPLTTQERAYTSPVWFTPAN